MLSKYLSSDIQGLHVSPKERLKLKANFFYSEIDWLLPSPRRNFHAFCVGLPRSGTHTIASLFKKNYASWHEPFCKETFINIMRWDHQNYSKKRMLKLLSLRDKKLRLDMEAGHYLYKIIDLLVEQFHQAKFILTIREPISWLESEMNQNLITCDSNTWSTLERQRYSKYNYEHEFSNLNEVNNIYPIRSYLSYWKDHIYSVLCCVPPERLLIIDTFELSKELNNIASFVGVDSNSLNVDGKHEGKRNKVFDLYQNVDRSEVQKIVNSCCKNFVQENLPFMLKYFN